MIEFTTYDINTGELLQTMRATEMGGVEVQCNEQISYVLGHWDRANHIVIDGEPVVRPEPLEIEASENGAA